MRFNKRALALLVFGSLTLVAQGTRAARPKGTMRGEAVRPQEEGVVQLSYAPSLGSAPDAADPGVAPVGSVEAATRQDFILSEAAKTFNGTNKKPMSATGVTLSPVIDAKTGLIKEDADALEAALHGDKTLIERDAAGPLGPGRRARLAEIVGLSPEEAAKLWPWKDPEPFTQADLVKGAKVISQQMNQTQAESRLVPGQRQDREEVVKNAVLTDAEASFAVYAALGLPFPIRVGKVDTAGITPDGFVLFSPELLRADPVRDDWEERVVTYRWMNNNDEVFRDTLLVKPFTVIPRPNTPTTHLWVTCDRDVMIYAPRGVQVPGTVSEARDQVQRDVVQPNSWLRPATKIYGVRWGLLPTVDELTKNTATREKLKIVMTDTGLINRSAPKNEYAEEFGRMGELAGTARPTTAPPAPRR